MPAKLIVLNVSLTTSKESLKELFERVGRVEHLVIAEETADGLPRSALIHMVSANDVKAAVRQFDGIEFEGQTIFVREVPDDQPAGFGGSEAFGGGHGTGDPV
jgi:RNA recognition motif-containing protein